VETTKPRIKLKKPEPPAPPAKVIAVCGGCHREGWIIYYDCREGWDEPFDEARDARCEECLVTYLKGYSVTCRIVSVISALRARMSGSVLKRGTEEQEQKLLVLSKKLKADTEELGRWEQKVAALKAKDLAEKEQAP
jgi:hypothetical protein